MYVCGAQVCDPHVSGARKKNVFRLEIAVHDAHIVKSVEAECLQERNIQVQDRSDACQGITDGGMENPQSELSTAAVVHQTRPSRWLPIDRNPSNPEIIVTNHRPPRAR